MGRNLEKYGELCNFAGAMALHDDINELSAVLATGRRAIPLELAERLAEEAPYFALPAVLAAKRTDAGSDAELSPRLAKMRERAALSASDAQAFAMMHQGFYPDTDKQEKPDTADTILTFLDVYGHAPSKEEDALLERMIMNPIPDYAATLEAEAGEAAAANAASDPQGALIDKFIATQEQSAKETPAAPTPQPPTAAQIEIETEAPLTESLAKTFIRQGRYRKAYEMFMQLNLNNSEKSVYFATQLRFLRKLMLINDGEEAPKNRN